MKRLLLLMMLLPFFGFSQKLDSLRMPLNNDGKVEFMEVVELKNSKSNDLFNNAIQFIAENYNSPETVTKLSDRTAGKLIVNTFFIIDKNHHINCVLQIDVKDGRYRYVFRDFTHQVVIPSLTGSLAPPEREFYKVFPNEYYNIETGTIIGNGTKNKIKSLTDKLKLTMAKKDNF